MPNRTMCDVLEEMRSCWKTRNFAALLGLVEEAQSMANRMESALSEKRDYESWHARVKKEKAELKRLLAETNKLRQKKGEETQEMPVYP